MMVYTTGRLKQHFIIFNPIMFSERIHVICFLMF